MKYTNWSDFTIQATDRGLPPAIIEQLRRSLTTYKAGGLDKMTVRWMWKRYAPWTKLVFVNLEENVDDYEDRRAPPVVLYPSDLLEKAFCCEGKPDIMWCFADRGHGKSVASYGLAESWLNAARTWRMSEQWGQPRVYVWGDVAGIVPSEAGWFRCPSWFVVDRQTPSFPLLEVYDEVPMALRAGGVSKATKQWAEKLTRSRHCHIWTVMNMVQATMASKRGREMDALTLDRHSGIRQLNERIKDMPIRQLRAVWREVIPDIGRMDPGLAMTQLSLEQGEPGTWLTLYETKTASWFEWREYEKKNGDLMGSCAPWPPEAVLQRASQLAEPIIESAFKQCKDNEEKSEEWKSMIGTKPSPDERTKCNDRVCRQILRGAGLEWAAVAEVISCPEPPEKNLPSSLQRWGHRYSFSDCSEAILEAADILSKEIPSRNTSPVCWGMNLQSQATIG